MDDFFHTSKFDIYLKESSIPNAGFGVFTKDFIPKGAMIDEYVGDVFMDMSVFSAYAFSVSEKVTIDAYALPRCYMAMLNDASHMSKQKVKKGKKTVSIMPEFYSDKNGVILANNCEFLVKHNRVFVLASRDIMPEEELFIDYGEDYWRGRS